MTPLLPRSGSLAALLILAGCQSDVSTTRPSDRVTADGEAARLPASATVGAVAEAAEAFLATLSEAERATLLGDLTLDNADNWSNFPAAVAARNGLAFGDLSEEQREAALGVARAALSEAGFATFQGIRAADEYLGTQPDNGPGGASGGTPGDRPSSRPPVAFDADVYYIAFLGTPSTTGPWMLQLGGHHYALNFGYRGSVASPTPFFVGVEPLTFTLDGTTYAPMAERAEMTTALLDALSSSARSEAQLPGSFNDVLLGPGSDFAFPEPDGVPVSSLTASQQSMVTAAINAWVADADEDTAAELLAAYTSDAALDETYVGYAGGTDLATQGSYTRIAGPRVWIEIVAQESDVGAVHYHSVWRDKALDYGGAFDF